MTGENTGAKLKEIMVPLYDRIKRYEVTDTLGWDQTKERFQSDLVTFFEENTEQILRLVFASTGIKVTVPVAHPFQMGPILRRVCLIADCIIFTPAVSRWVEADFLIPKGPGGNFCVSGTIRKAHTAPQELPYAEDAKWTWVFQDLYLLKKWLTGTIKHLDKLPVMYFPAFATNESVRKEEYANLLALAASIDSSVLASEDILKLVPEGRRLFSLEIPYLDQIPFGELATLLSKERNSLILFRNTLLNALDKAKNTLGKEDKMSILLDLQRDISSNVAKLDQKFRTIYRYRALRMSTLTLGSVGLTASALMGVPMGTIGAAATSLAGLLGREYAEYYKDNSSLRENPFYLIWRLSQKKHTHTIPLMAKRN